MNGSNDIDVTGRYNNKEKKPLASVEVDLDRLDFLVKKIPCVNSDRIHWNKLKFVGIKANVSHFHQTGLLFLEKYCHKRRSRWSDVISRKIFHQGLIHWLVGHKPFVFYVLFFFTIFWLNEKDLLPFLTFPTIFHMLSNGALYAISSPSALFGSTKHISSGRSHMRHSSKRIFMIIIDSMRPIVVIVRISSHE